MRTPLNKARAAFIRQLSILFILLIGVIGVQTMVSCSGSDDPGDNTVGGGNPPIASNCSLNGGTVNIGGQVWMAKNLDCNVSGSVCHNNDPSNCATYGRLYNWSTAMALPASCNSTSCSSQIGAKHRGICPSGWHIPSDAEWDALMTAVGGSSTAGRHLKSRNGWYSCGHSGSGSSYLCEDTYGFSALPGGTGNSDGYFYNIGSNGYWWSSSESNSYYAHHRRMYYSLDGAIWNGDVKSNLFSVRCLQD